MKKGLNREAIYLKLPPLLQDVVVSLEGKRLRDRRYAGGYEETYNRTLLREGFSVGELEKYRERCLSGFLKIAASARFWAARFQDFGVNPLGPDPFLEVAKLPILEKAEIRNVTEDLRPSGIAREQLLSQHTSGTTGGGLVFWATREAEWEQWAVWWRYRAWHGVDRKTLCGYFGGRSIVPLSQVGPPFWRYNRPGRQLMFSAYHLSERTTRAYMEALQRYGVEWIHGYPSTLTLLAKLAEDERLNCPASLRLITIGAESLLPHQRDIMSRFFRVPIRQHYGQAEAVANISECEKGALHIDEDFSGVELVPVDGMDGHYRLIGTNWSNPAFPLLRYDTGDIVRFSSQSCDCGRPGRIVSEIDGRREDYILLPSGARVGRLDHIFKDLVHVREAQIHQPEPGRIVLRVVKGEAYDDSGEEETMLSEARRRLGNGIRIDLDYCDCLPRTASGKLRFVTSDLAGMRVVDS